MEFVVGGGKVKYSADVFFLHPWVIQASTEAAAPERQSQRVSSSLPH